MVMMKNGFSRLCFLACLWALVVIMLGAYVRLSDAGLGCPDWPGCYGHIGVPETPEEISTANANYDRAVEVGKAWKEMIHRYLASGLGLIILVLAILAVVLKRRGEPVNLPLAWLLVGLVIFQGMLGMWTVTLKVKPLIVTLHLLFGMATLALLWCLWLSQRRPERVQQFYRFTVWLGVGLLLMVAQIALGGWVSTNYAAVACVSFPGCHIGDAWPAMDFREGFVLWRGLGIDYEFGVLESPARIAVHMTHRIGALIITMYWLILLAAILLKGNGGAKIWAAIVGVMLAVQILLGISNVIFHLPLTVAVLHNGTAAVLVVSVITLIYHGRTIGQGVSNG